MADEKPPKEINYAHLERYSSERLMEEQKIYRTFVEEYPPHSFPDVLIRLVQTERKLREELSSRRVQVEKPRRITRAKPRRPYE